MRRLLFFLTIVLMIGGGNVSAATLSVEIVGVASDAGDVHVALYNDPDGFPKSRGMLVETEAPIKEGIARAIFTDLSPGAYAIAVYHDENSSNKFDQGLFGIPLEDFGFSNDVTVFLSAPGFEDAAFDVPAEGTEIRIHLNR